jgi:DNA-binding CsgD family transcriptional regulator
LTAGVEQACRTGASAVGVERAVAAVVRETVPFDAWCALTIDPASVLPTGGFHRDGVPEPMLPRLVEIEARGEDASALPTLAHNGQRAVTLSTATRGRIESSQRYREVFVPTGLRHELRVLFTSKTDVWGALIMFRGDDAPDFSTVETGLVSSATVRVADAIRRELVLTEIAEDGGIDGPGLLLLDDDLNPVCVTGSADCWLNQIDDGTVPGTDLPYCVVTLARQARHGPSRSRIRTRAGRWLTLHAESLPNTAGQVSVIIEPTRPVEIAQLIADAFQLTTRERDVVRLLCSGFSRAEIAKLLIVSAHTIDDHVKRVFGKVGVRSRAELTAKLFFDQHLPRIRTDVPIGGKGWFIR